MAHFAKVQNGIVTNVIVAEPEFFDTFIDSSPGEWIQTSYNLKGGIYYNPETGLPVEDQAASLANNPARNRKNYAGVGYTYDREKDAFIPPKRVNSFVLNEETCLWEPPVAKPNDGKPYYWDEATVSWVEDTSYYN
jgi:hypothetical protein